MFGKTFTILSLLISVLSFKANANMLNSEKYVMEPNWGWITTSLNSESQSDSSYSIKYSFFERTTSKVYYVYDKKDTNKVLYKFVQEPGGRKATLYKKFDGENYETLLSLDYIGRTKQAHNLKYYYEYNILDKDNTIVAHFYYDKMLPWYNHNDFTGGFELRTPDNNNILIQAFQPDNESYRMELMLAPKLSRELLLAVSSFMIPNIRIHVDSSALIDSND